MYTVTNIGYIWTVKLNGITISHHGSKADADGWVRLYEAADRRKVSDPEGY